MRIKLALLILLLILLAGCTDTTHLGEKNSGNKNLDEIINAETKIQEEFEEIECKKYTSVVQKGELKKINFFEEKNYDLIEFELPRYENGIHTNYANKMVLIGVNLSRYYFSAASLEGIDFFYYDSDAREYSKYKYPNNTMLANTISMIYEDNVYVVVLEGGNGKLELFQVVKINILEKTHEIIYEGRTNFIPDVQTVDNYLAISFAYREGNKMYSEVHAINLDEENKIYEIHKTFYYSISKTDGTGRYISGSGGSNGNLYYQIVTLENQNKHLGEGDFYIYKYDFSEKKIVEKIVLPKCKQFVSGSADVFVATIATFGGRRPLRYRATSLYVKDEEEKIYNKFSIHYSHSHNPLYLLLALSQDRLVAYNADTMWLIDTTTLEYDKVKFRFLNLRDKGVRFSNPGVFNESLFYAINDNGKITIREFRPIDVLGRVDLSTTEIKNTRDDKYKEEYQEPEYQEEINIQIIDVNLREEHVIIKNFGSENIHIGGWKLVYTDSNSTYIFPIGYILLSGVEGVVVYRSDAEETITKRKWEGLSICSSSSGSLSLYDDNDVLISTFDWK
ncbi:MAG: hypothetical protein ACLKAK_12805 [Alkaliphilus sp.]